MPIIFNAPLTASFQPSLPILIPCEKVVLDFKLVIGGRSSVNVQWYPEFTSDNPASPLAEWYRETAEEDIGNGDVRMPWSIRRFSTQGGDAALPPGTYYLDTQFKRTHKFCRIKILGLGCVATVLAVFGEIPQAP
jgi:hypothetical protein